MKGLWVWRLRTHLLAFLLAVMLLTFTVVSVAIVVRLVPEAERRNRVDLEAEMKDTTAMLELLLAARLTRMEMVATLLRELPADRADAVLAGLMGGGRMFQAIYLLSPQGGVESAALPAEVRRQGRDLIGNDLSANPLYRAVQSGRASVWSGRYLSVLSGAVGVGLAYRLEGGRVLIGEMALPTLLRTLRMAAGRSASSIWVVDQAGEILAETDGARHVGTLNILDWPLLQAVLHERAVPAQIAFERQRFQVAAARAQALDWILVGKVPVGLDHPATRRLLWYVISAFLACLVIGLVIAPFWARRMARPLQRIVARAARTTAGTADDRAWPRGAVAEFNRLSQDLEAMASAIQDREQKFLAIFNASPVPMSVVEVCNGYRILDVNEAWCRQLMYRRGDVLGRTAVEIGLWTAEQRDAMLARMHDQQVSGESIVLCGDGQPLQVTLFGRLVSLPSQELLMWAFVDIGPTRRIERELRELNLQLEARVAHRTRALAGTNDALSGTVAQLREAQDELVRSDKMAALGSLVAGVAHELNTPLGNGVMAVSAMADATRNFELAMQGGLKRTDLQSLVDSIEQGVDIAGRNLRRAAELVHSFKQVAVDQTTAQRRSFELSEVVNEMVVSLRPSFSRTAYRIEVDVPATGLRLDSYPGALGQTIANLIQNAIVHGFDERSHGTVRIDAGRVDGGDIVLRVADDGKGIAAEHLGRVFDPFMTTKMGRGGSGLGLHISYNAVAKLLGGTLTVRSVEGEGTCFELRLPVEAPRSAPAASVHSVAGEDSLWL